MRRKKTLLILGGILVAAIIGIIVVKGVEKHVDKVNTVDEEVFTIDPSKVTDITIDYDNKLEFTKNDEVWNESSDKDFPIDQDYMEDFLEKFESVHASFIINDVVDYSQYGLKNATATISFTEDGQEKIISFGTFSTIDSKRYISVDGKDVYLIDNDILEDISAERDDYMANKEVPEFSQITKVEATGTASFVATYEPDANYTYTDDYDYYVVDGKAYKAIDGDLLKAYVDTIVNMDTTNYETYKATESDIKEYGLDSPDFTVTISGEVSKDDSDETENKAVTVAFSSLDEEKCYARVGESGIIYNIDADTYKDLAKGSYASLRPLSILSVELTNINSVACSAFDESFTVDAKENDDEEGGVEYSVDGEAIKFATAADKIKGLSLSEAGDSYSTSGKKELEFTVTLNDDDNTSLAVALYRLDGDSCVATLNGEVIGLVYRSSMSSLREEMISAMLNVNK